MAPSETQPAVRAVILGTDALMAARPATPIQLARACLRAGFDFVAPVSWGEELLATNVLNAVRGAPPTAAVIVHCPFVAEALREEPTALPLCYFGVAPPVATARYLREAFKPRPVSITYAGRCPGAAAPDIDASILPEILLGQLVEAGVVPVEQPRVFDEMLPPDRARYASLPGGVPDPALLLAATGANLREAAPTTLATVAAGPGGSDSIIIDLESSCGCVCGRDRFAVALLEPPRSSEPVVSSSIKVSLIDDRVTRLAEELASRSLLLRRSQPSVVEVASPPAELAQAAPDIEESLPVAEPNVASPPEAEERLSASPSGVGVSPQENEYSQAEPQSAEPGPEIDWFAELESDAAAFPEPEPYPASDSSAANPKPMEFAPLFEESLFGGMEFEPAPSRIAAQPKAESRSEDLIDTHLVDPVVHSDTLEIAVERAVYTDGPDAEADLGIAGAPEVAERQPIGTLEPWVRPSAAANPPPRPLHVDLARLGQAHEAIPTANPDAVLNERSPRPQDDEPWVRSQRIRHAALVVALGGLALAGSVYAATLTGWFGGSSLSPSQDSTPPLLPAYEVTRPAEAVPSDALLTPADTTGSDSARSPRRVQREAPPAVE